MSVCIGKDMGCRCQTCDSMLDCAPSPPAAPELPDHSRSAKLADVPLEHRAFCVYCGLGVGFDEDACCSQCGNGVESLGKLRSLLATQGLSIVDAKDRAVLEALGSIPSDDIQLALDLRDGMSGHERRMWCGELARREK
jgi:hypothetical protein